MSLIAFEDKLVRDLWENVPRLPGDQKTIDQLSERELVPPEYEAMATWAYVRKYSNWNGSKRFVLVHVPSGPQDDPCRVAIRLQGVISSCNLAPLGDWRGDEPSAAKARQSLVLNRGRETEKGVFATQCGVLNQIRNLIYASLGSSKEAHSSNSRIFMERVVFTKVQRSRDQVISNPLTRDEDPDDRARAIRKRWIVTDKMVLGRMDAHGKLVLTSHLAFKRGDFVDVKVVPNITQYISHGGKRDIHVAFAMERIVLLARQEQKEKDRMTGSQPMADAEGPANVRRVGMIEESIEWEGEEPEEVTE